MNQREDWGLDSDEEITEEDLNEAFYEQDEQNRELPTESCPKVGYCIVSNKFKLAYDECLLNEMK